MAIAKNAPMHLFLTQSLHPSRCEISSILRPIFRSIGSPDFSQSLWSTKRSVLTIHSEELYGIANRWITHGIPVAINLVITMGSIVCFTRVTFFVFIVFRHFVQWLITHQKLLLPYMRKVGRSTLYSGLEPYYV